MASIAALVLSLSRIIAGIAYATYSGPQDTSTFQNLETAASWLIFVSAFVVLCATCFMAWTLYVARQWTSLQEIGVAAISTLMIAIGFLINASSSPPSVNNTGNIVAAIGFGGWAIVTVISAARHALVEQEIPAEVHQAVLRLGGAGALVLIAVSIGLPAPRLDQASLAIATEVVAAAGFSGLLLVLSLARSRSLIITRQFPTVALGLGLLVLGSIAYAVGSGIVFGPPPYSIVSFRIALAIPAFIEALAFLVLAWAAFGRFAELSSSDNQQPPTSTETSAEGPAGWPPSASTTVPPSWLSDPTRRHELRWWDGVRWTEHVLDGNRPAVDPLG